MFDTRLLQEKCREQHQSLFFAFIDLTKAFDTINRELLWKVLINFGCLPHFLQIFHEFHDGMSARVTVAVDESDPFDVLVGVKQGCVLAPGIFNLFLVAVTLVFQNGLPPNAGIPSIIDWMVTYLISDSYRQKPKPHQTPYSTCSMQMIQRCLVTQQLVFKTLSTYSLPHISVLG